MLRPHRSPLVAIGAALVALMTGRAGAAPPEIFTQLALHPTDPSRMVLAYAQGGQGLLFSSDGGESFSLRCGAAVSASFTKSRAPLALTADGEVLLGTFGGLVRGSADGCGFADDAELAGLQVADVAPHPSDPTLTFLATANPVDGARTGLVRRNADGSFTALGASDGPSPEHAAIAMNRLAVATLPDGRLRFVATALAEDASGEPRALVRYSDDEGATWQERDVDAAGARLLLLGVDPTDPERFAIALSRDGTSDDILISRDAGQSFELALQLFELGGAAVAPDGTLWVGDAGGDAEYSQPGGLYRFDDFGAAPRKLATYPVRCLAHRALDGRLFGCERSTFGRIDPESGEFVATAGFTSVAAFVACGDEELAFTCKPQLCDNWCGVLHYANAPLCDAYAEEKPLCGPAARGYGQAYASAGTPPASSATVPTSARASAGASNMAPDAEPAACQIGAARRAPGSAALLVSLLPLLALGLRRRPTRAAAAALHSCASSATPRALSATA